MTPEQKKMMELQAELERLRESSENKDAQNEIIVIKGNRFLKWVYCGIYNFYSKIAKNYAKKKQKYSDKEFKLKEFKFESPRLILVTFTDLLTEKEYEITLHHEKAYLRYYEEYKETKKLPNMIRIDQLIKNNYKTAIQV